jgi:hypothetical protein
MGKTAMHLAGINHEPPPRRRPRMPERRRQTKKEDNMTVEERVAELEARVARLESGGQELPPDAPQECRDRKCTYYSHYLVHHDPAKNGPQMNHVAYHHAEQKCTDIQERVNQWMDNHETGKVPDHLWRLAEHWENKVCA